MTDPLSHLFSSLPGPDELRRWEEECARIDAAINDLRAKRERFGQMIELARCLMPPVIEEAIAPVDETITPERSSEPHLKKGGRRPREKTWKMAVEVIVKANPDGISYDKIKELIPAHLKEQLERFPAGKGFYAALARLEKDGVIVRRNGRAFTKRGYARYLELVAAGEVVAPNRRRGSPMEDAIKQFLRDNGPSKGVALRAYLIGFDEFAGPVIKNSSAMYNVLLRLKKSGEILHDEEAATYSIGQETGAPVAKPTSAPEAGEAVTSPIESQPTLRLIG